MTDNEGCNGPLPMATSAPKVWIRCERGHVGSTANTGLSTTGAVGGGSWNTAHSSCFPNTQKYDSFQKTHTTTSAIREGHTFPFSNQY